MREKNRQRVQCDIIILCLLQVKWGQSDLVALKRWSHEDHRSHRGHHIVGRDVFLKHREHAAQYRTICPLNTDDI